MTLVVEQLAGEVADPGLLDELAGGAGGGERAADGHGDVVLERRVLALAELRVTLPEEVRVLLADERGEVTPEDEGAARQAHGFSEGGTGVAPAGAGVVAGLAAPSG